MSAEELLNDLASGNFGHAGERLVDFMNTDLRNVFLNLASGIAESGGETAWSITQTAVAAEAGTEKSNEEKHASAKQAILDALLASGIKALGAVVDVLIKIAVRELNRLLDSPATDNAAGS